MIDLSKLITERKEEIINPIALFSSLQNKSKKYNGYLRNVQGEVLNQWFSLRNNKDNIIKMNTGSGKTTVALLILQSCLNEKKGNAVYVVPDNYLIQQVKEEAKDLGIRVVESEKDPNFIKNKAILIISIQKLINGKTVFDERNKIDNIVVDDVHACLDIAEQQFIIRIDRKKHAKLYDEIFLIFKIELQRQNYINTLDIEGKLVESNPILVPFWEVRNKYKQILSAINANKLDENYSNIFFPLSFVDDIMQYCNIVISYDTIEISPDYLPIYKVCAFTNAKRRIFISATLKDDGKLINSFDINLDEISNIITPAQALDIGNRMILFPQAINTNITDEEIKHYLKQISLDKRVVVIVPSHRRAAFWSDVADHVFDKSNIEDIKNYTKGLDILVNRYDGIDLKENLCSYLIIDGFPNSNSLFNQKMETILSDTTKSTSYKMQKIEQGMGRGIRSNQDDCAVIIMGKNLLNVIYNENALDTFSYSTRVQYDLSEKISEQLNGDSLANIMETFKLCLEKNKDWLEIVNKTLSEIKMTNELNYKLDDLKLNNAFRYAVKGNYYECIKIIQEIVNNEKNEQLKGYYMFYLAKYEDFINEVESQKILLAAKQLNNKLLLPLSGYDYTPRKSAKTAQSINILNLLTNRFNMNFQSYLYACETVFSNLIFAANSYKIFEKSINDLAILLGFYGRMPELEIGSGPDNIWDLGDNKYLVIECKNEANTQYISKNDCGQLCISLNWAKKTYGNDCTFFPVLIHKSKIFDKAAIPEESFKILTEKNLEMLKENVLSFCKNIIACDNINENVINELLIEHNINQKNIILGYLSNFEIK